MIPRISTKGMVFSLLSAAGDINTLTTTRLSVIVVGANPALSKSFYKGEYFELGRGSNLSINEIASMYQSETIDGGTRPGEMKITLADNSKAVDELGFNPVHNLQDYINEKHGL